MVLSFYKPAAADDREICKTASGNAAIAACTRVIESKKYAKKKFKRTLSRSMPIAASNTTSRRSLIRSLPITTSRSSSIRKTGQPTTTAAMPMPASTTTTTRSPSTTRPSAQTEICRGLLQSRSGETQQWQHGRRRRRHRASQGAAAGLAAGIEAATRSLCRQPHR